MKNRMLMAVLAALMMVTLFAGCSLAVPEAETQASGKDALCGVFITLEYLDAGATNSALPTDWNGDINDIVFPETRIWATPHEEENGYVDYTFDGIDGFRFFLVKTEQDDGEIYNSSIQDGPIEDRNIQVGNNDTRLSGTIYFDVHLSSFTLFPNPVYQTSDGDVYMVPGTGTGVDSIREGDNITMTVSKAATQAVDGVETSLSMEVEIRAESLNTNQKVVLKQMDENDRVIAQTDITQDNIPESIKVMPECAYMMLEEHCTDDEGEATVKRTLMKNDIAYISPRFTGEKGIVEARLVNLDNPNSVTGA